MLFNALLMVSWKREKKTHQAYFIYSNSLFFFFNSPRCLSYHVCKAIQRTFTFTCGPSLYYIKDTHLYLLSASTFFFFFWGGVFLFVPINYKDVRF